MRLKLVMATALFWASHALAGGPTVVSTLPGYQCMMIDLTEDEARDAFVGLPALSAPQATARVIGYASNIVAVSKPERVENGYIFSLFPNGQDVWIKRSVLVAYHSLSLPNARCVPARMSNGMIGFKFS